jgi:hypothetical protein
VAELSARGALLDDEPALVEGVPVRLRVAARLGKGLGVRMIILDDDKEVLDKLFEHVEFVGFSDHPYALERNISVHICKGARFGSVKELWPKLKKWR